MITNRKWLQTLTVDEFVRWLLYDECFDPETCEMVEPTPRLASIKRMGINAEYSLKEWLEAERKEKWQMMN